MSDRPEHIAGITTHARRGAIKNAFRYGVDYVLIDPEAPSGALLFSRNRFNLFAVHDRNHGGMRDHGRGVDWARSAFARAGFDAPIDIRLLTQPSFLGYLFNPVSFWLAFRSDQLVGAIAEVNNTYGDRHSYVCHLPDFSPITAGDRIMARKLMHVSPFQDVGGDYQFNFDISRSRVAIRIMHKNGPEGVVATLAGERKPLTDAGLLGASIRRPAGAFRTITLIHWQALILKLKGAVFRPCPKPPIQEVTPFSTSKNA